MECTQEEREKLSGIRELFESYLKDDSIDIPDYLKDTMKQYIKELKNRGF